MLTNSAVVLATGMVGVFGTHVLAGFGLGIRVEYLQIPLVFGIGSAMVPMVGMNVGAGQLARARRVAWTGALVAVAITETVGLLVAIFPEAWLHLFTGDDAAIVAGTAYLRQVGPFYGFFGLNLGLFFASQGAARMVVPTFAAMLRLIVIVAGGIIATTAGGGYAALLVVIVLGHVFSAGTNCLNWIRPAPRRIG